MNANGVDRVVELVKENPATVLGLQDTCLKTGPRDWGSANCKLRIAD